jgi:ATP-dependent Clp protease ATP-binding subunit ClpA
MSLESVLPHSIPVATSVDLPITPDLQVVFEYTETLRNETGHSKIEPLHLFAGVLHAGSGIVIDELQKAGITYDSAMRKLQSETGEE